MDLRLILGIIAIIAIGEFLRQRYGKRKGKQAWALTHVGNGLKIAALIILAFLLIGVFLFINYYEF